MSASSLFYYKTFITMHVHMIVKIFLMSFTKSKYGVNSIRLIYMDLTLSDPTSDFVRQYDFLVLLRCRKTSDTALVGFVSPLSEPVRRFFSCSTDFSQQIAQVVFFLFLRVFLFENCRIITSNPPTSLQPKTNKSWGICGWQNNWIEKG
jgi:hypothetical protein